jgi:hypothetical protein
MLLRAMRLREKTAVYLRRHLPLLPICEVPVLGHRRLLISAEIGLDRVGDGETPAP